MDGEPGDNYLKENIYGLKESLGSHNGSKQCDNWYVGPIDLMLHKHEGVSFGLLNYMDAVVEHICHDMPDDRRKQCDNTCAVAYKVFPDYVGDRPKSCPSSACGPLTIALSHALNSSSPGSCNDPLCKPLNELLTSERVGVVHMERDEADRRLSTERRFSFGGHPKSGSVAPIPWDIYLNGTTLTKASSHVNFRVEFCWASLPNYRHCMQAAVATVGLGSTFDGSTLQLKHSETVASLDDQAPLLTQKPADEELAGVDWDDDRT